MSKFFPAATAATANDKAIAIPRAFSENSRAKNMNKAKIGYGQMEGHR